MASWWWLLGGRCLGLGGRGGKGGYMYIRKEGGE